MSFSTFMEFFFALLLLIFLIPLAWAGVSAAPWVPTWRRDRERMFRLVQPKAGEVFYELGCGDGRVVREAVRRFGVVGVGVEISLLHVLIGRFLAWRGGPSTTMRWGNLFQTDLSQADIVYLFLMPKAYEKIRPKLEAELKPGSRVVTYVWPIPGWKPGKVDAAQDVPALYLYRIPSVS